jgi:succinoglycan biosynthesis transport protein ExoP
MADALTPATTVAIIGRAGLRREARHVAGELERLPERGSYPQPSYEGVGGRSEGQFDLREVARVLSARRFTVLLAFAVVVAGAAVATFTMPPLYRAKAVILVEGEQPNGSTGDLQVITQLISPARARSVETEAQILRSDSLWEKALQGAGLKPQQMGGARVEIEPYSETDLINVAVVARDKKLAKRVANSIVDTYLKLNLERVREATTGAVAFARDQLRSVDADLAKADAALTAYKEKAQVASLSDQTTQAVQQLGVMDAERNDALAEARDARAKRIEWMGELKRMKPTTQVDVRTGVNPEYDRLRSQIGQLEADRTALLSEYQPTSPKVTTLDARIADLRKRLAKEDPVIVQDRTEGRNPAYDDARSQVATLRAMEVGAEARSAALDKAIGQKEMALAQLPEKARRLAQLQREVDSLTQTQASLSAKYDELRIAASAKVPSARVIDPAIIQNEGQPVSPNKRLNLAVACILGLFLGIALAFAQEYLDDTVKTTDDVQHNLGTPVLGHIALAKHTSLPMVAHSSAKSPLTEGYRILRSNIAFTEIDTKRRTLLVTSTGPGEGKSVTVINLGTVIAQQGKRVILVDTDLRRPALHSYLGLPNGVGLSNLLIDSVSLEEAIQDTEVPHMQVITSGPLPPNPADLLASDRTTLLIERLKDMADIVIFDSPPSAVVTDAQILSAKVEGVIVVTAAHQVTRRALARGRELLDHARAPVIGAVLNKIDISRDRYYDDYYYYYSHYEYYTDRDNGDGKGPKQLTGRALEAAKGKKGAKVERS